MALYNRAIGAVNQKIVFNIPVTTLSPLRIASGHTDNITDILVLKNKKGEAFIPATSLAGVLRNEMRNLYGKIVADFIFGNSEKDGSDAQSLLTINDIVLSDAKVITRDGVKIHSVAGTGEEKAKYDFEAVEKGAEGVLTMEMTIRQGHLDKILATKEEKTAQQRIQILPVKEYLHPEYTNAKEVFLEIASSIADLMTAGIHVGALTTKGLGLIKSIEPAKFYLFDFMQGQPGLEQKRNAAEAWWQFIDRNLLPKEEYTATEAGKKAVQYPPSDFVLEAKFAIKSSLLIRDVVRAREHNLRNEQNAEKEDTTIAAVPLKSGNDFVIPGTSVKGALRAKAYKILMTLSKKENKVKINAFLDNLMGRGEKKIEENDEEIVIPGKRGRLLIDEIYLNKDASLHEMKQSRNRIDRFTGATIDTALFSEVAVWQTDKEKPALTMKLRVKNAADTEHKESGLMLLLLRDLWTGTLPLGGGKGIGRGVLQGISATVHYDHHEIVIQQTDLPAADHANHGKMEIKEIIQNSSDLNTTGNVYDLLQSYVDALCSFFAETAGELHE